MMCSDAKERASKLKVMHETDCYFQNVVRYKTNRLLDKSQTYNGKISARTGKYAKRMEPLLKVHKVDDVNPITILRFLAQFK